MKTDTNETSELTSANNDTKRRNTRTTSVKTDASDLCAIRSVTDADISFIFSSWLKSAAAGPALKLIKSPIYYAQHHKLIEGYFKNCVIKVACNPADHNQIIGYICFEVVEDVEPLLVVHYAYVKADFRNLGIAKALLAHTGLEQGKPFFYTTATKASEQMNNKINMAYSPYLA